MNKWKQYIPDGMQDFLPEECYNKRKTEEVLRRIFYINGYNEIETPIFEYFDVFADGKTSIAQEQLFKIPITGGRILVLRPDITMPIARIAATKLKNSHLPLRLSYISSVYRYEELQVGKQRDIAQGGIELLGVPGPEADAEIISIAIQVLLELGLKDFQIDIGQVDFFKGLIEEAGLSEQQAEEIRYQIDHKNMLALESYLKDLSIPANIKKILLDLPRLYGSGDMLETALALSDNIRCCNAIRNIQQVYEILRDYGLDKYITFDLGMVQSLNYYTGIIFRGITRELGYPICGGGRYDGLVSEFGYDIPATGVALGIKRILIALERQKGLEQIPLVDVLLVYDDKKRKEAFKLLQKLRAQGKRVEVFMTADSNDDPILYARRKSIKKVVKFEASSLKEITVEDGVHDNNCTC